ncbi:hypothetical protein [Lysinibacillus sp. NPDC086135]|uniref:hypothetical protein n=1 Tax=Lysinibacillus sp. NPDC086135 TaxID=3364130 RepID=UPI0038166ED7
MEIVFHFKNGEVFTSGADGNQNLEELKKRLDQLMKSDKTFQISTQRGTETRKWSDVSKYDLKTT